MNAFETAIRSSIPINCKFFIITISLNVSHGKGGDYWALVTPIIPRISLSPVTAEDASTVIVVCALTIIARIVDESVIAMPLVSILQFVLFLLSLL